MGNSSAAGAGAGSGYGQTAYGTAGANATAADGAGNYAFAKGTGALEAEGWPGEQRCAFYMCDGLWCTCAGMVCPRQAFLQSPSRCPHCSQSDHQRHGLSWPLPRP